MADAVRFFLDSPEAAARMAAAARARLGKRFGEPTQALRGVPQGGVLLRECRSLATAHMINCP